MKNIINCLALIVVVLCCAGAGPCWKHHNNVVVSPVYVAQPNYVVSYVPLVEYRPVVVQSFEWVPVVQNRVVYGVVNKDYWTNNTFYYVPSYVTSYPYNPWATYNY